MTRLPEILLFLTATPELMLLIKTSIILALGLFLVRVARSTRASVRHLILACTFVGLFALPFATILAPSYQLEITSPEPEPVYQSVMAVQNHVREPAPVSANLASSSSGLKSSFLTSTQIVVWSVWGAGAFAFLASLAFSLFQLRRIRRSGIPSLDARVQLKQLASEAGISRDVDVLLHHHVSVPFTYGFFRPVILLPTDAWTWHDLDLHRVFVHELEHIKRGDWLVQVFTRAVCSIYWFQPLAWIAWRQICLEAERASDDAVVARSEKTDYAEQLVGLARRLSTTLAPPVLSMANRSDLSRRVRSILDNDQARGRLASSWTLWAAAFSALLVVGLAPGIAVSRAQSTTIRVRARTPNTKSRPLDRALVEAAESGEIKDLEELLSAGANINGIVDGDGTALIVAAREGNKTAVEFLIGRGADVNLGASGDGNPLIMASREGHVEIVRLLLDHSASVDLVVEGDENALIQASGSGQLEVVRLLVSRGANVNARVWTGDPQREWRTPLGVARKEGHNAVVEFLISAGARE
ncbi:MAG: hypothetical protein DMF69_11975 [Acidobacteria bacterium]|nr:MAG: hypothetical protein DMF69_11975 [Acidobacteriota bacterium]